MKYLILTEEFCNANKHYTEGVNHFGFAVTNQGLYVTPKGAINDFPNLFRAMNFQEIELEVADFWPIYTPPASNGNGIVIPDKYAWVFPIQISGYQVELKQTPNGIKYIESSCLTWRAFLNEFGKKENQGFRSTIYDIWVYASTQATVIRL